MEGGKRKERERERDNKLLYCERTVCLPHGYNVLMRTSDGGKYRRQLVSSPSYSSRGGGGALGLPHGYNFLVRTSDGGKYGRQLASSPSSPSPRGGRGLGTSTQLAFLRLHHFCKAGGLSEEAKCLRGKPRAYITTRTILKISFNLQGFAQVHCVQEMRGMSEKGRMGGRE